MRGAEPLTQLINAETPRECIDKRPRGQDVTRDLQNSNPSVLHILGTLILIIACLYWARAVLILLL